MKRVLAIMALILATGCDDQQLIVVKDGEFGQTRFLSANGIVVHHIGLYELTVGTLKHYAGSVNFTDGGTVIIDLGRTDEAQGTSLEQFHAAYADFMASLIAYDGRNFICVQRSEVFTPPCDNIIFPSELNALYDSLINQGNNDA